jgi:hypothetical protein
VTYPSAGLGAQHSRWARISVTVNRLRKIWKPVPMSGDMTVSRSGTWHFSHTLYTSLKPEAVRGLLQRVRFVLYHPRCPASVCRPRPSAPPRASVGPAARLSRPSRAPQSAPPRASIGPAARVRGAEKPRLRRRRHWQQRRRLRWRWRRLARSAPAQLQCHHHGTTATILP